MKKTKKSGMKGKSTLKDSLEKKSDPSMAEDDIEAIFSGISSPKKCEIKNKEDEESDEEKYFSVGKDGRRYHEGLPVYTLEELQLGDGGGDTEDCPIYCDCCT
ncbi:DUF1764 domain-containing protein [Encephalitozoon hellem]|nr:DUF1764 domain-containing protein [Encephalitozoon hellem]